MSTLKSGFSLIELLVVVAIIGILASVGTVGYQNYIDGTRERVATTNIETIAKAVAAEDLAISAGITGTTCSDGQTENACADAIVTAGTMENPYTSAAYTAIGNTALDCTAAATVAGQPFMAAAGVFSYCTEVGTGAPAASTVDLDSSVNLVDPA